MTEKVSVRAKATKSNERMQKTEKSREYVPILMRSSAFSPGLMTLLKILWPDSY